MYITKLVNLFLSMLTGATTFTEFWYLILAISITGLSVNTLRYIIKGKY